MKGPQNHGGMFSSLNQQNSLRENRIRDDVGPSRTKYLDLHQGFAEFGGRNLHLTQSNESDLQKQFYINENHPPV